MSFATSMEPPRRQWRDHWVHPVVPLPSRDDPIAVALPERGGDDVCPVDLWADVEQDDHDADQVRARANCSLV